MEVKFLIISALFASSFIHAGLLQTVAEMPGKAIQATGAIVKDVVTAPEDIVKDTVTAPAKVVGAVPMEERKEALSRVAAAKEIAERDPVPAQEQESLPEPIAQEEEESEADSLTRDIDNNTGV